MVFPTLTTDFVVLVTNDTCTNRDTVTVTVNQLPNADAGPDTAICIQKRKCAVNGLWWSYLFLGPCGYLR